MGQKCTSGYRLFLLSILSIALTACGGGGGSDGTPSGGGGSGSGDAPGGGASASLAPFAGTMGGSGNVDGVGAAARFNFPEGVATDSAGNVYVADSNNHIIRKITPAGAVSTLVGVAGQVGFGPGALPGLLSFPSGVAVSGTSLYITLRIGVAVVQNLP